MIKLDIPKLRFKDFDDEWEKVILNEIVNIVGGGTPSTSVDEYWDGNINWFSPTEVGESVYVTESEKKITQLGLEKSSAKILPADKTILFTSRAGIGDAAILKIDSTTNQGFQSLVLDDKTDIYFLYSQKENLKRYATKNAAGSTFLEISGKELGKMPIIIPSLPKQSAIGTLFQTLDELLSAYRENLTNYQAFKVSMLSKMFPKAGQTTPEIRLDGFDGEWEEKKLKNLSTHRGGTAIEKFFDEKGIYKVISIGSYGIDNKYFDQNIRASSNEITDNRVVHKGELTMVLNDKTSNGTIIGRCLHIEEEGVFVINQRTEIITPSSDLDSFFAYVSLNGPFREKVKKIVQGGTQIYVNYSSVEELTLFVPALSEQRAIGSFFSNLDTLISFQQERIEQLENLKKKLLKDMFI